MSTRTRGFTIVEVLLAMMLLSILVLALIRLLDTSLGIWSKTETNRDFLETSSAILDLFADDVYAIEGGPKGDFLGEWVRFDTDRDGTLSAVQARVRLVRQVTAAELLRLHPGEAVNPRSRGLVEVCWALLPQRQAEPDERSIGVLWRGIRSLGDEQTISFFDERFFDSTQKPVPGSMNVVSGGVLWFEVWYAGQTSIVHDGWKLGSKIEDCAAAWDAWNKERPNLELSELNEVPAGMPRAKDQPLVPRRMRLLIELEPQAALKWRTRIAELVEPDARTLEVVDELVLPPAGRMILVDEEWMKVVSVSRGQVAVERGLRGTRAAVHEAGALIHHGNRALREIPIPMTREDWDL
jgi:prepilin-type N-terminal cleavage/methylation domain-containing protein